MSLSLLRKTTLALASLALYTGFAAAEEATISLSQTAPTDTLLRIAVPEDGFADPRMIRNWSLATNQGKGRHRETGQTFNVPVGFDYEISAITLRINEVAPAAGVVGKTFSISIYEVSNKTSATPLGPALYEAHGVFSEQMSALDYITFSLSSPFLAKADTFYSIQIGFSSAPDGASELRFATGASTLYLDGTSFFFENPAGSTAMEYGSRNYDLDFALSGRAIPAIPEGRTASLLIGGTLACAVTLFIRRRSPSAA